MSSSSNDTTRQELLRELWTAEAEAMLAILKETPREQLRGSTLKEIRQFLADNGVHKETLDAMNRTEREAALQDILGDLPAFPQDELGRLADLPTFPGEIEGTGGLA